jgi:hypothetical protein
MADEVVVDALPYIDHGYDDPGVRSLSCFCCIYLCYDLWYRSGTNVFIFNALGVSYSGIGILAFGRNGRVIV